MGLMTGTRVLVWKRNCGDNKFAGGYEVQSIQHFGAKIAEKQADDGRGE